MLEFLYIVHGLSQSLETLGAIEASNIFIYLLLQPSIQVRHKTLQQHLDAK